jgi:hypothetical protein
VTVKVTITDKDALRALSWRAVEAYLDAAADWQRADDIPGKSVVYQHTDKTGRLWEIIVLLRDDLADYASRMGDAVSRLARIEDRSELDVYDDLKRLTANGAQPSAANADALREVHEKIRRWLAEENLAVRDVDDPQSSFNVMAMFQSGQGINIYQLKDNHDHITLHEHVVINDPFRLEYNRLPDGIRLNIYTDIFRDSSLLDVDFDGLIEPINEMRYRARIYFDGLTKDTFLRGIRRVLRAYALSVQIITQGFEAASQPAELVPNAESTDASSLTERPSNVIDFRPKPRETPATGGSAMAVS